MLGCQACLNSLPAANEDEALAYRILGRALEEPMRVIAHNSGFSEDVILDRIQSAPPGYGFDARQEKIVDLREQGILDAVRVLVKALEVAVSGAGYGPDHGRDRAPQPAQRKRRALTLKERTLQPLKSPSGGSVTALVIAAGWAFAGSNAGVLRARIDETGLYRWELLPDSPLGVLSLAATHFAEDHSLLAGTPDGIFTSDDGGLSWKPAQMPIAGSTVLALGFTGIEGGFLAGTLEDGVCITKNYGRTWESRNFGLLDQAVFALVFSPEFIRDGTAFLGAEGALYHTYNHARAWQELTFPPEALPVLSLALAPDFHANPTVFAGSETQGLWVSHDRGSSWSPLALPASTVNALAFWGNALLAATESGLYQSVDLGTSWTCLSDQANCLCLAVSPELALAGWAEAGIMQSWSGTSLAAGSGFQPAARFTGLIPAPGFPKDGHAFVYGPGEGLWQTIDSGASWQPLAESLPFSEINNLIGYANNDREFCLLAASPEGLWLSPDGALSWRQLLDEPTTAAWASPSGKYIAGFLAPGRPAPQSRWWGNLE